MGYEIDESEDCLISIDEEDKDEKESVEEGDNVILDIDDNTDLLIDFENRLPQLKKNRSIGTSFISEVTGSFCKLCDRFFLTKETSDLHTKSICHYEKYIQLLKKKHQDKKKNDASKDNVTDELKIVENIKREAEDNIDDDNEGNWKRRKTISDEENVEDKKNIQIKDESLYDPMEAEEEYQNTQNETAEKLKLPKEELKGEQLCTPIKSGATIAQIVVEDLKETEEIESLKIDTETNTEVKVSKSKARPRIGPLSKTRGSRSQ